ncbi:MAG TPA: DUF4382 domain-containing protein [Deltaproteobacteria bacterium]|nr:DUF4382 domain-containing protein [Deltaproteobacteria bacterium]
MNRYLRTGAALLLVLGAAALVSVYLAACSSGGSSHPEAEGSYGSVGVLLTDAPTDGFDHIYITITGVSLLPEGEESNPVVVFTSSDGYTVDLLDLRDEDFLLILNEEVPVGRYEKIRLAISGLHAVGGPCEGMDLFLPGGRIDINPQGAFTVDEGQVLYLRLDIDADRSIHLHEAGNSGKCVFRPVVFADVIARGSTSTPCSMLFRGAIDSLLDADLDASPDGFIMGREFEVLGDLRVHFADDMLTFSENNQYVTPDSLQEDQAVVVYGYLTMDGVLQARLVVIGDVLVVEGSVTALPAEGEFTLSPGAGEELSGDVDAVLLAQSLVMTPCGEDLLMSDIAVGSDAEIIGRYDTGDDQFTVLAVLLSPGGI